LFHRLSTSIESPTSILTCNQSHSLVFLRQDLRDIRQLFNQLKRGSKDIIWFVFLYFCVVLKLIFTRASFGVHLSKDVELVQRGEDYEEQVPNH